MRFGTETITYRGSQIWNLIPDSVLKMDLLWRNSRGSQIIERRKSFHVGFVKHTCKTLALSKHKRK